MREQQHVADTRRVCRAERSGAERSGAERSGFGRGPGRGSSRIVTA